MTTIFNNRKITRGFQITLPPFFREKNNLQVGDTIEIIEKDNELILKPKRTKQDILNHLFKTLDESVGKSDYKDLSEEEILQMADEEIKKSRRKR